MPFLYRAFCLSTKEEQAENECEQSDGFADTDYDEVVSGSLSGLSQRIASAGGALALHEGRERDGHSTEDTAAEAEERVSSTNEGGLDEVHQKEAVDGLCERRSCERDEDERDGLASSIAFLPAANRALSSGASSKSRPECRNAEGACHS